MIALENIQADINSSFRILYQNVMPHDFSWDFHYHPEIELVFVFDGIGRRHVGNHISYYENGDLVLIGSALPHSGFGYGALGKHEEVVIQFNKEIIQESIEFEKIHLLLQKAQFGLSFSNAVKERFKGDFRAVYHLSPWKRYIWLINLLNKLASEDDFVVLNETNYRRSHFSKDQNRILRIFDFVKENYAFEIDVKTVADNCSLTLPAFCNYFKKTFGVSFTDFLNEYRINQSCLFLTEGQSVTNVAYLCGFNSLSYFSRLFKELKKITPTEFQMKAYNKNSGGEILR